MNFSEIVEKEVYRSLSSSEVGQLVLQGCHSEDWSTIKVHPDFQPEYIQHSKFSGEILLGKFEKEISLFGGITFHSGIYNSTIHNCVIGNDVFIHNVKSYIANYIIEDDVKIENTNLLAVDGVSTFGNGTRVKIINEGGGRDIPIFDYLSAHTAYIMALYRHKPEVIQRMEKLIHHYTQSVKGRMGVIGQGTSILNCDNIKNVKIGAYARLEGVCKLINGSVNSSSEAPVVIGDGVIMEDFIVCSGSRIKDASLVTNCFVGQGCILDKHYSAVESVFFANCQGFHGEATSIFAGPYTVTHHKSTLLIAGMFSFLNAGSGSNQSNHLYKLGPIHQGIVERGAKTTSDSYILWPSKIGAFTLVMGRHYKHSDTTDFPFSYLIEHQNESYLVPAINISSIGTVRDSQKWPRRDQREDPNKLDYINFNLLSPFTVHKMITGRNILKEIKKASHDSVDTFHYEGMVIDRKSLERGIELYTMAIHKFLGNSLITRIQNKKISSKKDIGSRLTPDSEIGKGNWVDLSGLVAPAESIEQLMSSLEEGKINSIEEVDNFLSSIYRNYYNYEWTWAYHQIESEFGVSIRQSDTPQLIDIIEKWKTAVLEIDHKLLIDAKKEFSSQKQTGFGIDGNEETKEKDFNEVRNSQKEAISTISSINEHMRVKEELGNTIIQILNELN